ncbi:carbon-nitrogen hydrolase family protein [uncultured Endozoicomonas sp.]|uniref:carbon-nitrogen hydrolase family protein n=1 Tax=uncultured Endozoicomonas sp. TaxID=432652 RepID=UPI002619E473|nr:carbon-nitrogen hydrolase family protein [uncultured Endozoicomonas sp.]
MPDTLNVAVVQVCSGINVQENLSVIREQLSDKEQQFEVVLLPECFAMMGSSQRVFSKHLFAVMEWMSQTAKRMRCWLIGGALPVPVQGSDKSYASCRVYSPEGKEVAVYNKMHLFDVDVSDNKGRYRESDDFEPGKEPVLVDIGKARIGLSICYDLRFPELYRYLVNQGASILTVPSAFTKVTGKAHWEALLRARAIENQCYVLAANQAGTHPDGRQTYGRSMIISPWGEILAEAPEEGVAVITAELDLERLADIRQQMPCLSHQQLNITR